MTGPVYRKKGHWPKPTALALALVEAGLDLNLSPTATLGASYAGQFGDGVADNAVKGRFTWLF